MQKLRTWLDALWSLLDVRGRRQERLLQMQRDVALHEAAKHEQLMEMLEMVLSKVQEPQSAQTEAITEVAKSMQLQAQALHRWFGLFEQTQGEGSTHTIRPEDEADQAEQREVAQLREKGYPVDRPASDQLAWLGSMFGHQDFG